MANCQLFYCLHLFAGRCRHQSSFKDIILVPTKKTDMWSSSIFRRISQMCFNHSFSTSAHFYHLEATKWKWQNRNLVYRPALLEGALLLHRCFSWQPRPPHKTNLHPESLLQDLIHCMFPGSPPLSQMVRHQTFMQFRIDSFMCVY